MKFLLLSCLVGKILYFKDEVICVEEIIKELFYDVDIVLFLVGGFILVKFVFYVVKFGVVVVDNMLYFC